MQLYVMWGLCSFKGDGIIVKAFVQFGSSQLSFQCSFQCSIPPFHSANSRQLTNSVEKRNSWNQGQLALQFKDVTRTFLIYMHLWWYCKLCIKIDSTTHINDYINKTFHIHKFYVISHTPTPLLYYIQVQL